MNARTVDGRPGTPNNTALHRVISHRCPTSLSTHISPTVSLLVLEPAVRAHEVPRTFSTPSASALTPRTYHFPGAETREIRKAISNLKQNAEAGYTQPRTRARASATASLCA